MADASNRIRYRAHPALAGIVVRGHGYRLQFDGDVIHRALPVPVVPMIFSFGPNHRLTSRTQSVSMPSFIAGVSDAHVLVRADEFFGIQVDLTPLGATQLLRVPAGALAGQLLAADDVLGSEGRSLNEQLTSAMDWPERFAILERFLLGQLETSNEPPPALEKAWDTLGATGGTISIAALAAEVGWSSRHLYGQFAHYIGLSPKRAARVWRFHRTVELLESATRSSDLASVALQRGYYDQAHMTNEVRSMAGVSPSEILAGAAAGDAGLYEPV